MQSLIVATDENGRKKYIPPYANPCVNQPFFCAATLPRPDVTEALSRTIGVLEERDRQHGLEMSAP